jgi:signal transduction histidine kinase
VKHSGKPERDIIGPADFLAGGGEIGALMRAKSWADTLLGPAETWPDALKMAVGICLNSRFPISLWWGSELVMLYNDAWRPILGKTKHPAGLGRPGIESWPEIWDIIGPQFTSVLTKGEATWSDDLLLVLERNNYREEGYFTYSYSPIKHSDGSIGGVFSAINETTERVIGERRLRILRELAAQTAESKSVQAACEAFARVLGGGNPDLPFAILYLLDEDGTSASLLAKTGLDDAFAPATVRLDHDDPWGVARVIRDGNVILLDDLALRFGKLPGGVWPEPTTSAIVLPVAKLGQKGDTAGVLVAGVNPRRALDDAYRGFFDLVAGHLAAAVSNARAYEEERKRAEGLAEIDRAKTQFFSNVSHEFRTPLTLMLGPLEEVLAKPETNPLSDDRSLVQLAHRNGVRLLKLVNTLLDFSRIEAGRAQASFQPVDLAIFTAELASNFQSAIEKAGLHLVVDCPSLPQQVYVDADMWEQVVLNLLSNAFKFTFEGEIAVAVRPSSDGRCAEVTVRDTGTGIPLEELSHLFERFHRVEGARGRSIEGTGIGLALVQELIKLHGGSIRVASEAGQGSAFTVAIPFGVAHLPAQRVGRGRTMAPASVRPQAHVEEALGWLSDGATGAPVAPQPSASDDLGDTIRVAGTEGQLVLVADDNADMRNYLQRLLRAGGFRVEAVTDGKKALAAARRLKPDLVLSDVMMPELDGFGLLAALRKDVELRDTPVLLLSARAGEEAKVEGLSAGADDYLVKPFSARELLARVGVKLQLARTRRERLEQRLRQAEKMEAVGRLAGGIAHDFNNVLAGIFAYGEMLVEETPDASPLKRYAQNVLTAATRGRALVEQILTYSRTQRGRRTPVDIARVVAETLELVRGSLPPNIRLEASGPESPLVMVGDPTQLHQVVMNLCSNAIQAMSGGGTLRVTLETTDLSGERALSHGTLSSGRYVRLIVEDSGSGMDEATLCHIFEPFFTTKEIGQGTGLGLALVYAIVTDSGGAIDVRSTPKQGSTFTIYGPLAEVALTAADDTTAPAPRGNGERVLLVDDEAPLLAATAEVLSRLGYEPVSFSDSRAALAAFEAAPERFDVIVTDEVMPGLTGTGLAGVLRRRRPSLPIVLLSGYSGPILTQQALAAGVTELLTKPLHSREIAATLARVLHPTA